MPDTQLNVSITHLREVMDKWLKVRLTAKAHSWITGQAANMWSGSEDWEFFTTFSKVPRYTGKDNLDLTEEERVQAVTIREGWKPYHWSLDQLGRSYILLSIGNREKEEFLTLLQKTYETSDVGEAEALYKSLPILPYPADLQDWAAEGIRTNMTSVFNAVAHQNPYPADYLKDDAWNQMVLKALFVESPLYLINGIDQRANQKLAGMLIDYAHERWAADRDVSPELWRPIGPFAKGEVVKDLQKALNKPDELQKQAAILALSESPSEKAQDIINNHKDIKAQIEEKKITWQTIGKQFDSRN